jgi:hypothetical protein
MARRKNTKFIDPRYFMDEKMETSDEELNEINWPWKKKAKSNVADSESHAAPGDPDIPTATTMYKVLKPVEVRTHYDNAVRSARGGHARHLREPTKAGIESLKIDIGAFEKTKRESKHGSATPMMQKYDDILAIYKYVKRKAERLLAEPGGPYEINTFEEMETQ